MIKNIIPTLTLTKYFGLYQVQYSMLLANDKIIFAKINSKDIQQEIARRIKESNLGWTDRIKLQFEIVSNYYKKFIDMPLDTLINNKENIVINLSDVIKIEYKLNQYSKLDDPTIYYQNKMIVKTNNSSYNFKLDKDYFDVLKKNFNNLIKK